MDMKHKSTDYEAVFVARNISNPVHSHPMFQFLRIIFPLLLKSLQKIGNKITLRKKKTSLGIPLLLRLMLHSLHASPSSCGFLLSKTKAVGTLRMSMMPMAGPNLDLVEVKVVYAVYAPSAS